MAERETAAEIEQAAAHWAVRADDAEADAGLEMELRAWLGADVRRLGAYARARAALMQAARIKALGPAFDPDAYLSQHAMSNDQATDDGWETASRITRRRFLIGGSAATAAAATAVGIAWPAAATTYSTKLGEVRLIPLPDGSGMTLNTLTTAKVLFTKRERHIELVEGEALFDVASDPKRPFVVEAGRSVVKAATSSFTVSRLPEQDVQVTVRQGRLQLVARNSAAPPQSISANTRAIVEAGTAAISTVTVPASEMSRDTAWQQGMLSFEDTPLRDAARQFARYSDTSIRFEQPDIGEETITGLYAANNPQGFAKSAAVSLGLRSSQLPGSVVLSRQ